jgi:hypothetical protein
LREIWKFHTLYLYCALCILGPPEPPLSVEISEIGADYLTVSWEAGFDGGYRDRTSYQLEYTRVMDTRTLTTSCPDQVNHCNLTGIYIHNCGHIE